MYTIVNNNMVNGIRRVSVERGYDPRDFVLVGAGGATAAHITALAREIGIDTIILPKLASGLCAFGQIISDVKYNYMATAPVRLDNDAAYKRIDDLYKQVEAEGRQHLVSDGFTDETIEIRRSLDMRYVGQVHECTVDIDMFDIDATTIDRVKEAFHRRHKELYTYAEPHNPVEVVNIESTLYGRIEKPKLPEKPKAGAVGGAIKDHRDAIFDASGNATRTPVYDGEKIGTGEPIKGPAIIEEVTTTIVIEPGWIAVLDKTNSYLITRDK
jgi:N-methylhydantoinase A